MVLTVPCGAVRPSVPIWQPAEQARLSRVVYQGIVCPSLLLKRPLGGYYVTNITDQRVPFTAVIEMTALVDRERFGGHSLVYLPRYLTQQSDVWKRSDEELVWEYVDALARMYPGLSRSDVVGVAGEPRPRRAGALDRRTTATKRCRRPPRRCRTSSW